LTYRCARRPCTATVRVLGDDILKEVGTHRHEALDLAKFNRQKVSATVKRKATEDICERPSKVIRAVFNADLPETFTRTDTRYVCPCFNVCNIDATVCNLLSPVARCASEQRISEICEPKTNVGVLIS